MPEIPDLPSFDFEDVRKMINEDMARQVRETMETIQHHDPVDPFEAIFASASPPRWSQPDSDPLSDIYDAMVLLDGNMTRRARPINKDGVYVITTLPAR